MKVEIYVETYNDNLEPKVELLELEYNNVHSFAELVKRIKDNGVTSEEGNKLVYYPPSCLLKICLVQ